MDMEDVERNDLLQLDDKQMQVSFLALKFLVNELFYALLKSIMA